jgi:hypothetical protein
MTSCLDCALCISMFLHTYPYIHKAFHLLNTQKFYTCKLMKNHDSQRRSEAFDARGGEPQWLLLTEITNLKKKITDICWVCSYLAQEFRIFWSQKFIYLFSCKISILQPKVAATAPPSPRRSRWCIIMTFGLLHNVKCLKPTQADSGRDSVTFKLCSSCDGS